MPRGKLKRNNAIAPAAMAAAPMTTVPKLLSTRDSLSDLWDKPLATPSSCRLLATSLLPLPTHPAPSTVPRVQGQGLLRACLSMAPPLAMSTTVLIVTAIVTPRRRMAKTPRICINRDTKLEKHIGAAFMVISQEYKPQTANKISTQSPDNHRLYVHGARNLPRILFG